MVDPSVALDHWPYTETLRSELMSPISPADELAPSVAAAIQDIGLALDDAVAGHRILGKCGLSHNLGATIMRR